MAISTAGRGREIIPGRLLPQRGGSSAEGVVEEPLCGVRCWEVRQLEPDVVAGRQLSEESEVRGDHDGRDAVAAGGLMVGRENDRATVRRELDRAPRHAVGQGLAGD